LFRSKNAAAAGALGALAWKLLLRTDILLGVPTFDIVCWTGRRAVSFTPIVRNNRQPLPVHA